jgi:hypothetical protein
MHAEQQKEMSKHLTKYNKTKIEIGKIENHKTDESGRIFQPLNNKS